MKIKTLIITTVVAVTVQQCVFAKTTYNDIINNFPIKLRYSENQVYKKENLDNTSSETSSETSKNTSKAKYYVPDVINTYSEWENALEYFMDNLKESATLKIENFDNSVYNLEKIRSINASIKSNGTVIGNTANIDYTFTYKDNYKIAKAAENPIYLSILSDSERNIYDKCKTIVSSITNSSMSEYEKEKAIHDYIVLNFKYDTSMKDESYTISGLFKNNTGVCEAYAYLFKTLCNLAGIECNVVVGTLKGSPHGWNMVKIGGEYYHIDVTSDDPVPDLEGMVSYQFFNVTDTELSKTHMWEDAPHKCNSSKYNYFNYNDIIMYNVDEMQKYIIAQIAMGKEEIMFYTKGFVINGTEDFMFCQKSGTISSFYIMGDFGKEGAFRLIPTYR